MTITLNSSATNNADWKSVFQFEASYDDGKTFDLIDFTDATIKLAVNDADGCQRLTASTDDGKIAIVGLGTFELSIPASEMACLCPASYQFGTGYSLNGDLISLSTGTLSIVSGVVKL